VKCQKANNRAAPERLKSSAELQQQTNCEWGICQRHKPKPKPAMLSYWASKLLAGNKIVCV